MDIDWDRARWRAARFVQWLSTPARQIAGVPVWFAFAATAKRDLRVKRAAESIEARSR